MNNKRLISLLAAAAMVASITPTNILAEEINNNVDNIIVEGTNQGSDTTVDGVGDNATDSQKPDGTEEVMPESKSPKEILKEKINNAQNGATITLESNIEMGEETLVIPQGKEIVLDLAGYTISAAKGVEKGGFTGNVIENNGTLTVKNGTVSAFNNNAGTYGSGIKNNGTLIIDEDTDKNTKVIGRSGIENNGTATVNGGTIESYNRNAYWGKDRSKLTVNGGEFRSETGSSGYGRAISSEGNIDITAGEFYSGGSSEAGDNYMNAIGMFNGATLNIKPAEGKTVKVTSKTDYAVSSMNGAKINIYGGEFACEGNRVDVMKLRTDNRNTINVYGGTFKHKVYDEYLADDYIIMESEEGFVVKKFNSENVNVYGYGQLESALNNPIESPKKINIKSNITIPNGKNIKLKRGFDITIDSGKKLTVAGILCLEGKLINNGNLEVTNKGFIQNPFEVYGNGTILDYPEIKNDVCKISTPMELQWLSKMVEDGKTPKEIILENDIIMPNAEFTSIGARKYYTNSIFNGLDHKISNININVTEEYKGGLFGRASDVEIKNLKINGKSTNSTSSYIGALAGFVEGNTSIKNVHIENYDVTSKVSYGVGGFVGQIGNYEEDGNKDKKVEFIGCTSNANVTGYANVGGFWGTSTECDGKIEIYDCAISGNVKALNVNAGVCGGFGNTAKIIIKGLEHDKVKVLVKDNENKIMVSVMDSKNGKLEDKSSVDRSKLAIKNGNWEENITNPQASLNGVKYADLFEAYNVAKKYDVLKLLDNIEL